MLFKQVIKNQLRKQLTSANSLTLVNRYPLNKNRFEGIDELGLYLHIPFCRQICPYCPYNKEIFQTPVAERYTNAVIREIDLYAELVGDRRITSFYIGGGTPTTMLNCGLERILGHLYNTFNIQCDIHLESHPNDLTPENLDRISCFTI